MTPTEELRAMLDERGVEWYAPITKPNTTWFPDAHGINCRVRPWGDALQVMRYSLTPAQAIAATLGDTDATEERQADAGKVYLVETSNELLESWYPFGVYLSREAAEDCAEALTYEHDGIRNFVKVSELKVVDE